jgi:hypothetical protein
VATMIKGKFFYIQEKHHKKSDKPSALSTILLQKSKPRLERKTSGLSNVLIEWWIVYKRNKLAQLNVGPICYFNPLYLNSFIKI